VAIAHYAVGPLLAGTLGVATFGIAVSAGAFGAPPSREVHAEIVVTAVRPSDEATSSQVMTALQQDPYIFSGHVMVTTKNGVVRLEGIVHDLSDLYNILRLARRIAGNGRVVNQIEYVPTDDDGN
jgi:osmotically-inducible protein OsmY